MLRGEWLRSRLRLLSCTVVTFGACALVPAVAADRFTAVREQIRAGMIEQSVPSIAVAVAQDGKILWEEGFGWADLEKRVPASEHTPYSLASISKPITTTGLMLLVEAGKVNLDAPANDYLGNAKLRAHVGDVSEATVRRVANHTAGLPYHHQFFYADEPYMVPSREETILRYGMLVRAPGEKYEYSNLGYGILDYIIERVSGQSYAQFMRQEVFVPLGLTRTSVNIGPGLEEYVATRYGDDGRPLPFYDFDHPGASAVFASAHDLVRFGMFHLKTRQRDQKAILSDAAIDAMHRRSTAQYDDEYGYGIGFGSTRRNGHRIVSHSGGMAGVSTVMQLFPDAKLAVVVLSNSGSWLPVTIADRIAAVLLPHWTKPWSRELPPREPFITPTQLLGAWKGTLATHAREVPFELHFQPDGDVHVKVGDQLTLLERASFKDGEFTGRTSTVIRVGTPDADRFPARLQLSLKLRSTVLDGAATSAGDGYGTPRIRSALSHWVEVRKQ